MRSFVRRKRRGIIKKFKFTLEALLRVRKVEENVALAGYSKVMERVNVHRRKQEEARAQAAREMAMFSERPHADFSIEEMLNYDRYLDRLGTEERVALHEIDRMRPELEREKQKLLLARRNRKIVETVKERKFEEYKKELRKKESKEYEELNGLLKRKKMLVSPELEEELRKKPVERDDIEREEEARIEKEDAIEQYFKKMGMEDPRKKSK